jgi:4a-hydroxytetrahydrobiopterin dehydratase
MATQNAPSVIVISRTFTAGGFPAFSPGEIRAAASRAAEYIVRRVAGNDPCTEDAFDEIMKVQARAAGQISNESEFTAQEAGQNARSDRGVSMSKLSEAEILERLPRAKDWERHGDMLVRTWQFPSFRRAMEFVNQVAALIEKNDHHPDLFVRFRTVRIEMSTHDVGGLTDRDFALIAGINEIPTDR